MADDALAARLLVIFIDELDEQVQQLNDDLLALERTPDDGERLRAVFRVMHTLKGAARAAGLPLVEELCHALENELSRVRDGSAKLGAPQIALLFETADALAETRDSLRRDRTVPEAVLSNALHHARGRGSAAPLVRSKMRTPSAPMPVVAPIAAPIAAPIVERVDDAARAGHVRVSLQQVDAIAGAAGEIAGLAATLTERADALAALRARRRASRVRGASDDGLDRELTLLLRHADEDARALSGVSGRLGVSARHLRQRPFGEIAETLPRVARDVARDSGKQVRVVVVGSEIEADRVVLEALREPLLHLVRNAVDHGIEPAAERTAVGKEAEGELRIEGSLRGDRLQVTIADDGRGLDLEAVRRALVRRGRNVPTDPAVLARAIFDEGFTTREAATTLSGRGVGMGIVRAAAERMGGTVEVSSVPKKGTTITIDVPISIATMRVVLVEVGGVILGVPSTFVVRVDRADPRKLARVDGRAMLVRNDRPIPVTTLAALLGPPFEESPAASMLQIVVLESGPQRLAVVVDDLLDERELVLRPLEHAGSAATNATVGTALLGTGVVALVLSVPALLSNSDGYGVSSGSLANAGEAPRAPSRILVVDDSITSRTLEQSVLSAAGYDVITAVNGAEAWRTIERQDVALVVSDVEMPHLDGFELCARIRANARTATLPVILVTSLDEPAQRARGLEAGADAYITKSSFDQDTLLDTVRMLIGRSARDVS
ncbi:MAG: cheA [Gemmatimonadetes bacterium]|nr:cheA [Gemmatimonadota bacterium]